MLQIKIGQNDAVHISNFMETKDFIDRNGESTIRIDFENINNLEEDTIENLESLFKNIPSLILMKDGVDLLRINKKMLLYRIIRETKKNKIFITAVLVYAS